MYYEKKADEINYYHLSERNFKNNVLNTGPHYHDSIELFLVVEGYLDVTVNGIKNTIHGGEIVFVNGYDIHSYYSTNCKGYVLVFTNKYCSFFDDNITFNSFIKPTKTEFDLLHNKILEYVDKRNKNLLNKYLVESLCSYIIGQLYTFCEKLPKIKDKTQTVMVSVMDYINDNYSSEITLPSVSNEFGYTPNYFSTLFNKFARMNFNDYLNFVRYNKAKKLLNDNVDGRTVTDVAISCGFGSMNTFYRAKNKFDNK